MKRNKKEIIVEFKNLKYVHLSYIEREMIRNSYTSTGLSYLKLLEPNSCQIKKLRHSKYLLL